MKKELKEFLKISKTAVEKLIKLEAEDLMENNSEEYEKEFCDYGYFNNGVGMACCGGDYIYDEEKAREDAINKIADSIQDGDIEYLDSLLFNKDFRHSLANLIRSL